MADQGQQPRESSAAERRWRRTVDVRGEVKLKVARLLRDFGFSDLEGGAIEAIEARLASVGLTVEPGLRDADPAGVVSLTTSLGGAAPVVPVAPVAPTAPTPAAPAPAAPQQFVQRVVAPPPDLALGEGGDSLARAENRRLLEERTEVERRLQSRTNELRGARRGLAVLQDSLDDTRAEVQRTAQELQLALTGEPPAAEPSAEAAAPADEDTDETPVAGAEAPQEGGADEDTAEKEAVGGDEDAAEPESPDDADGDA